MAELKFLLHLWKANLQSAMEYRFSFLMQVFGMMLNNAVYFVFWVIFFDRFESVRGWGLTDMFILLGVVASAFGLGVFLFGNARFLADLIAEGKMDYYLSLPRPVLLHALASRSIPSGLGDFIYGILSFMVAGVYTPDAVLRFVVGVVVGAVVYITFLTLVQSLAFWTGSASMIAMQVSNAMLTFALYPLTLFEGATKLILFTVLPAALMGSVPAEFVRTFTWGQLGLMLAVGLGLLLASISFFNLGLRRYESGSAIQVQV